MKKLILINLHLSRFKNNEDINTEIKDSEIKADTLSGDPLETNEEIISSDFKNLGIDVSQTHDEPIENATQEESEKPEMNLNLQEELQTKIKSEFWSNEDEAESDIRELYVDAKKIKQKEILDVDPIIEEEIQIKKDSDQGESNYSADQEESSEEESKATENEENRDNLNSYSKNKRKHIDKSLENNQNVNFEENLKDKNNNDLETDIKLQNYVNLMSDKNDQVKSIYPELLEEKLDPSLNFPETDIECNQHLEKEQNSITDLKEILFNDASQNYSICSDMDSELPINDEKPQERNLFSSFESTINNLQANGDFIINQKNYGLIKMCDSVQKLRISSNKSLNDCIFTLNKSNNLISNCFNKLKR